MAFHRGGGAVESGAVMMALPGRWRCVKACLGNLLLVAATIALIAIVSWGIGYGVDKEARYLAKKAQARQAELAEAGWSHETAE